MKIDFNKRDTRAQLGSTTIEKVYCSQFRDLATRKRSQEIALIQDFFFKTRISAYGVILFCYRAFRVLMRVTLSGGKIGCKKARQNNDDFDTRDTRAPTWEG